MREQALDTLSLCSGSLTFKDGLVLKLDEIREKDLLGSCRGSCRSRRTNFSQINDLAWSHKQQQCQQPRQDFPTRFNTCFHHFRFVVVFLGGLSVGLMSLLRLNITVAILNMVNQTKIYLEENPGVTDVSGYFGEGYEEVGEFDWDNEIQQTIISYYMIAYTLPQLLTTKLAIRIGVRWSIPLCIGTCALSCMLTPMAAYHGWQYVTLLRLLNGLGASAILPIMVYVIEHWMPVRESALGLTIIQFVQSVLFTLSPLISAYLASVHWCWAFYLPAALALAYCLIWLFVVNDDPATNWLISQQELAIICGCGGDGHGRVNSNSNNDNVIGNDKQSEQSQQQPIAWTRALRVPSFYALTAVWICYCSSFGSFSFLVPSYLRQVLKVPIIDNGMLCFILQSGCLLSAIWPQPILHLLQAHKLSLTSSRRLVMALICIVTVVTYLLVAGFHQYQVAIFSINRIFHLSVDTLVTSTIMSQYHEAGISSMVYSVINSVGNLSTVFFCMGAGELLDATSQSVECWSWIFVAMGALNLATVLLYSTCVSSKPIKFSPLAHAPGRPDQQVQVVVVMSQPAQVAANYKH